MRYIFIVLVSLIFLSCGGETVIHDINVTDKIDSMMDKKLLGTVEAINSTIAIAFALFTIMLAVIGVGFYNVSRQKKEIKNELEDQLKYIIDKKFKEQNEEIYNEINQKTISIITKTNKKLKHEFQKEEFLRNMLFNDLNRMRATEQRDQDNISIAFSNHVDRYNVVSQLTSGIEKEQTKALRKLSTGVYRKIIKLESFKNYINFLKNSEIDLDTLDKIAELELELQLKN